MKFNEQKPIYLQIADLMDDNIVSGQWAEGTRVPSVREMGVSLAVNPATVLRAYEELSGAGIIEQRRGVGYFVCEGATKKVAEKRVDEFYSTALPRVFEKMELLGITFEEVAEYYNTRIKK